MSVVEMKVPVIGESINEVTLSQWLKPDGSFVKIDEPICEFESDKATLEFPAEAEGKLIHVAKEGDDLTIGAIVAKIDTSVKQGIEQSTAPKEAAPVKEPVKASTPPKEEENKKSIPSPAAAKILREGNVTTSAVSGTGKEGRITKGDALQAVTQKTTEPTTPVVEQKQEINSTKPAMLPR